MQDVFLRAYLMQEPDVHTPLLVSATSRRHGGRTILRIKQNSLPARLVVADMD